MLASVLHWKLGRDVHVEVSLRIHNGRWYSLPAQHQDVRFQETNDYLCPKLCAQQWWVYFTKLIMGKPNQVSWMMPFLVLGKCTWRYSLRKFDDVDSAMRFNINRTILSNHSMLFGGKRQAHWQHCILQQTGSVDRSNLWKISWIFRICNIKTK